MYVNILYNTSTHSLLTEHELSASKYVEDTVKLKYL